MKILNFCFLGNFNLPGFKSSGPNGSGSTKLVFGCPNFFLNDYLLLILYCRSPGFNTLLVYTIHSCNHTSIRTFTHHCITRIPVHDNTESGERGKRGGGGVGGGGNKGTGSLTQSFSDHQNSIHGDGLKGE